VDSAKAGTLVMPDSIAALPVVLTDTIRIQNDSLHIRGNSMRFLKSSAYDGPAFALASTCKYLLLENLTLENFDVGVLVRNRSLHLKNVRFIDCRVPVQYQFFFFRQYTGKRCRSSFFHYRFPFAVNLTITYDKTKQGVKHRTTERFFLLLVSVVLALLFVSLYNALQKDFETVPQQLQEGRMVDLNSENAAQQVKTLLQKGFYFEDRQDVQFIHSVLAQRLGTERHALTIPAS
jgi:hypothetical protein